MPAIRRNKRTNKWEYDYKNLKGKRQTKGAFATKVEAERAQAQRIGELSKGLLVADNKITFIEAAELYISNYSTVYCKESTVKSYKGYLKHHINPYFGSFKLCEIRPIHIQSFIKDMTQTHLSNATINKFKKLIGAIFNYMIDSGVIARNPAIRIKSLKEIKTIEMRPLSIKEASALLEKTKKHYPYFYPLLYIAINTGMREGELLALTWDSINFIERNIVVNKSYTHGVLGTTKTEKVRKVKISTEAIKVLKEWRLACPHSDKNLVFPNNEGNYQDSNNMLKRRFRPALALTGIEAIRFHDLRHTYASTLIHKNAQIPYISKQLGHSTNKTTLDTYVHLLPETAEMSDSILEDLYSISEEPKVQKFGN